MALIVACVAAIARLRAEESMLFAERIAMGIGRKYDLHQVLTNWQRDLGAGSPVKRKGATPGQLKTSGIKVVRVGRRNDR